MRQAIIRRMLILTAIMALLLPTSGYSATVEEKPSALAMAGDAVFVRPVLFGMTIVGAAIYVISLPFSALGGNMDEAGETLVVGPARATFVRCLGCTRVGKKGDVVGAEQP
jgi:hypothetical protein